MRVPTGPWRLQLVVRYSTCLNTTRRKASTSPRAWQCPTCHGSAAPTHRRPTEWRPAFRRKKSRATTPRSPEIGKQAGHVVIGWGTEAAVAFARRTLSPSPTRHPTTNNNTTISSTAASAIAVVGMGWGTLRWVRVRLVWVAVSCYVITV